MPQPPADLIALAELDAMPIEAAQALPFAQRDRLLDMIIAAGRHDATAAVSHRTGLYTDYFEEDLTRMLKVRAVKVYCRGTTSSDFHGHPAGGDYMEQYRACFRHVETILSAARTGFARVVKLIVFLTNMDLWPDFNRVYREFIPNPPCRAVIGTTGLAQKPLPIEIVECVAYRVAD